jgi:RNA polymerase sigma factor (sigma-70 family)
MVLRAVRRRLTSRKMRSIYESTDFVNDVWRSLAARPERYDFDSIEKLQAFLVQKARRKVLDELRKQTTQKRDIERQQRLDGGLDSDLGTIELAGPDPTPSQIVLAEETRDRIQSGLSTDEREIIELRQSGYNNDEISKRTGWNVRKVQRFLQDLRNSWKASKSGAGS